MQRIIDWLNTVLRVFGIVFYFISIILFFGGVGRLVYGVVRIHTDPLAKYNLLSGAICILVAIASGLIGELCKTDISLKTKLEKTS